MNIKEELYLKISEINDIAVAAGKAVMEIYESDDFDVEIKGDNTPLTKADKISNNIIIEGLKELMPDIPIISEENKEVPYDIRKDYDYLWMIDPIDGTKEFINKNGAFTINIALIHKQESIGGVVYLPAKEELFYAFQGRGAFMIKNGGRYPMKSNQFSHDDEGLNIISSKSHLNDETLKFISQYKSPTKISVGSSLKFIIIAQGKADIYPRLAPTMEWDTAAAQIILEESGGRVIRADNREKVMYNKENLLNPHFIAYGIEL